jgi:hypothetical protein
MGVDNPLSDWVPESVWGSVQALKELEDYAALPDDLVGSSKRWREWMELERPGGGRGGGGRRGEGRGLGRQGVGDRPGMFCSPRPPPARCCEPRPSPAPACPQHTASAPPPFPRGRAAAGRLEAHARVRAPPAVPRAAAGPADGGDEEVRDQRDRSEVRGGGVMTALVTAGRRRRGGWGGGGRCFWPAAFEAGLLPRLSRAGRPSPAWPLIPAPLAYTPPARTPTHPTSPTPSSKVRRVPGLRPGALLPGLLPGHAHPRAAVARRRRGGRWRRGRAERLWEGRGCGHHAPSGKAAAPAAAPRRPWHRALAGLRPATPRAPPRPRQAGSVEALGAKLGYTAEAGKYFAVALGQVGGATPSLWG